MIATVNLNFAVDIAPVFHVVPSGYDISVSQAVFELRDKTGAELYAESSAGITVETITLTAPLKYADGTEIDAGTEVAALRVAPALSSLPLGDPEHVERVQYRYKLRVDDAWKVQGWWTVWPDTGPAECMGSPIAVCCGPQQIAVTVGGGFYRVGGYLEIDFVAADLVAGGLPLPVSAGSVPNNSLIKQAVVRFNEYFDTAVSLAVGQDGNDFRIYSGPGPEDPDGHLTLLFRKFSGEINVYPDFTSPPTVGSGTIFLIF
jgi:hypothetical protein